jgi:hypothetical protein
MLLENAKITGRQLEQGQWGLRDDTVAVFPPEDQLEHERGARRGRS